MRVIIRGIKPSERVYRCTCNTCTSVIEYKESEAEAFSDQREGSYRKFNCPECMAVNYDSSKPYIPHDGRGPG
jgi:hypothetical protein